MAEESQGLDPYDLVLADLRTKRDQIDQLIQALESLRGISPAVPSFASTAHTSIPVHTETTRGAFLGMTIPDATKALLASRRQQLSNAEIVASLKSGGLVMNSADPINTVGSVLTRRFNQIGDIVRVGRGIWGLAEWYPNRSFKKKPNATPKGEGAEAAVGADAVTTEAETSAPERPLETPQTAPRGSSAAP